MARTISDRLTQAARASFVGRKKELEELHGMYNLKGITNPLHLFAIQAPT